MREPIQQLRLRLPNGSDFRHRPPPGFCDVFLAATDEPQAVGDLIVSRHKIAHPATGAEITLSDDQREEVLRRFRNEIFSKIEVVAEYINSEPFDEFQERLAKWYQQIPEESRPTAEVGVDYHHDDDDDVEPRVVLSYRRRATAAERAKQDEVARQRAERDEDYERKELARLIAKYPPQG